MGAGRTTPQGNNGQFTEGGGSESSTGSPSQRLTASSWGSCRLSGHRGAQASASPLCLPLPLCCALSRAGPDLPCLGGAWGPSPLLPHSRCSGSICLTAHRPLQTALLSLGLETISSAIQQRLWSTYYVLGISAGTDIQGRVRHELGASSEPTAVALGTGGLVCPPKPSQWSRTPRLAGAWQWGVLNYRGEGNQVCRKEW